MRGKGFAAAHTEQGGGSGADDRGYAQYDIIERRRLQDSAGDQRQCGQSAESRTYIIEGGEGRSGVLRVKPAQGGLSFLAAELGPVDLRLAALQAVPCGAALRNDLTRRTSVQPEGACCKLGLAGGILRGGFGTGEGCELLLRIADIVRTERGAKRVLFAAEGGKRGFRFLLACVELRQLVERARQFDDLGLQRGDAAGLIILARVELLFE